MYLKKNVGSVDQVIRIFMGIGLVAAPVLFHWSPWATAVVAAFGGSMILEGPLNIDLYLTF